MTQRVYYWHRHAKPFFMRVLWAIFMPILFAFMMFFFIFFSWLLAFAVAFHFWKLILRHKIKYMKWDARKTYEHEKFMAALDAESKKQE